MFTTREASDWTSIWRLAVMRRDGSGHREAMWLCQCSCGEAVRARGNPYRALDEAECFIDATFVMAKGGGAGIGPTKRGKGMKIMAIVDRHGLPLSVSTHAANHHEVRLVQLCFD